MRAFAQLFTELDRTPRGSEKVAALERYFRTAPRADAAWALWFIYGKPLRRPVGTTLLRRWAAEASCLPLWLVEECYHHVGDLGEALALLLPSNAHPCPLPLAQLVEQRLLPLAAATASDQRAMLLATWAELDPWQRFLWHRLLTGNFRAGVPRALVVRALANLAGVEPSIMEHRLMGDWRPAAKDLERLLTRAAGRDAPARSYPFLLALPLEGGVDALGETDRWQVEWKWDGLRAQLLRRAGETVLWSGGEEIVTGGFPEVAAAAAALPDGTVLDGELLAWRGDAPLPLAQLQRRLNRREVGLRLRQEVPVVFMAYDVLEQGGEDWRGRPLSERRIQLETLIARAAAWLAEAARHLHETELVQPDFFRSDDARSQAPVALRLSPVLAVRAWDAAAEFREQARRRGAEGLVLKRRDSVYGAGRQRGAWWDWKLVPFTCAAVLVAAQPGHGRRAALFTDCTFAVWQGNELVPVAKAQWGLTDEEMDGVDAFVRANTIGRFGPVRSVKPEWVFELAFEGIAPSLRHKAGFTLRGVRIARQRHDKVPAEADTVERLRQLVRVAGVP